MRKVRKCQYLRKGWLRSQEAISCKQSWVFNRRGRTHSQVIDKMAYCSPYYIFIYFMALSLYLQNSG